LTKVLFGCGASDINKLFDLLKEVFLNLKPEHLRLESLEEEALLAASGNHQGTALTLVREIMSMNDTHTSESFITGNLPLASAVGGNSYALRYMIYWEKGVLEASPYFQIAQLFGATITHFPTKTLTLLRQGVSPNTKDYRRFTPLAY
jgi:hypothetical protein